VQVEPTKPTLKPPVSKRLKLLFGEPLSSVAFNFNMRRYHEATLTGEPLLVPKSEGDQVSAGTGVFEVGLDR